MQQLHKDSSTRSVTSQAIISLCSALIITLSFFATNSALADTRKTPLDSLRPTSEHKDATEVIAYLMQQYHYSRVKVDDELSDQIFDRYLESLDPQKVFFLASDIKSFEKYRLKFDDALRKERLKPVFEIFKTFRARVDERSKYATELLSREFDFTIDENYTFNREDEAWPADEKEADDLWRKRVKNDVLNLRLAERTKEELTETLEERYTRMDRRISQLKANDVFQIFINAYTLSVEPHTSYFSPRSSEEFKIDMSLSLEGIGAALNTVGEYTVIQRLITGGPAALSQELSVKDRIVGVGNGTDEDIVDVVSWPLADVVDLIRGPKGTTIRLNILSDKAPVGTPPKLVTLTRDKIKLEEQAAKRSIIEVTRNNKKHRFGVIDLPTFYLDSSAKIRGEKDFRSTTRDVQNLINELTSTDGGVDGIIVDLRGNGGGALTEATQLTGLFIETGPVVQIRNANGTIDAEVDEDPTITYDGPLAVLVDRYSASASEIFAAAIQDYGRGVILGEPTFGKGTVQTVAPLDREDKLGQLKITIAQFFRVNGDGTQFRGVVPDVLFPTAIDSDAQGERNLDNALPWAEVDAASYDAWSTENLDYSNIQSRHETRYKANDSFALLKEELVSQREARSQRFVSLVEKDREAELLEQSEDREKRVELFRRAFGASASDEDDNATEDSGSDEGNAEGDDEGDAEDKLVVADIILEEAANVLKDIIDFPPAKNQ